MVVHSTTVKEDNPELAAARARGLNVLRRGEMLARLMEGHTQVAITGAHGKTSTTAMTAAVLRAGDLDPTVVVGSVWDGVGSNAVLGRGDYFVAESDESDGSFALSSPRSRSSPTWTGSTWTTTGTWPTSRRCSPRIWQRLPGGGQGHRLRRRPESDPGAAKPAPMN